MQDASDEVFKQICVQSDELTLCYTNKRFYKLYKNKKFLEGIYHQKCEQTILQDTIALKPPKMKWKRFYERVMDFRNRKFTLYDYCMSNDLLGIKLYASIRAPFQTELNQSCHLNVLLYCAKLNPPVYPSNDCADFAVYDGKLKVLKYCVSLGLRPRIRSVEEACQNGKLKICKYCFSLTPSITVTQTDINMAAEFGHFKLIKYYGKVNPPMYPDVRGANNAAKNGRIEILKYLESRNPPILADSHGLYLAAVMNQYKTLKYLVSLNIKPPVYLMGRLLNERIKKYLN